MSILIYNFYPKWYNNQEVIKIAINKDKKARMVINLEHEYKEIIDKLAKSDGRSTSNYVGQLLKKHAIDNKSFLDTVDFSEEN